MNRPERMGLFSYGRRFVRKLKDHFTAKVAEKKEAMGSWVPHSQTNFSEIENRKTIHFFWSYRKNWKPYSEVVTSNLNVKPSAMMVSSPQTHHLPPDNPKNHLYWRLVHGPSWAIPLTSSWPLGNGISFSQAPAGHGLRKQWIWAAKYYRRPQDRWKSETNV